MISEKFRGAFDNRRSNIIGDVAGDGVGFVPYQLGERLAERMSLVNDFEIFAREGAGEFVGEISVEFDSDNFWKRFKRLEVRVPRPGPISRQSPAGAPLSGRARSAISSRIARF